MNSNDIVIKSAEETDFSDVKNNYLRIKSEIDEAMDKAGRTDTVRIMAVTKTVPTEKINYAESLGIDLLGENRVQEFLEKYEKYSEKSEIHFIGGLQNNKVKYIIDKVAMIHSVDSIKLAAEIDKRAAQKSLTMDVLLEINIAGQLSKGGFSKDEFTACISELTAFENIKIKGLMAIPPAFEGEMYFPLMQELFNDAKEKYSSLRDMDTLSMGMSGDYLPAVKYGSNIVRIGSGLFGYRNYTKI